MKTKRVDKKRTKGKEKGRKSKLAMREGKHLNILRSIPNALGYAVQVA